MEKSLNSETSPVNKYLNKYLSFIDGLPIKNISGLIHENNSIKGAYYMIKFY